MQVNEGMCSKATVFDLVADSADLMVNDATICTHILTYRSGCHGISMRGYFIKIPPVLASARVGLRVWLVRTYAKGRLLGVLRILMRSSASRLLDNDGMCAATTELATLTGRVVEDWYAEVLGAEDMVSEHGMKRAGGGRRSRRDATRRSRTPTRRKKIQPPIT